MKRKSILIIDKSPKSPEKSNQENSNNVNSHFNDKLQYDKNSIIKSLVNSNQDPIELIEKKPWHIYKKKKLKEIKSQILQFDKLMQDFDYEHFEIKEQPIIFDQICNSSHSIYHRIIKNNINSQDINDKINFFKGLKNPNLTNYFMKSKINLFDLKVKFKRRKSHEIIKNESLLLKSRLSQVVWGQAPGFQRLRFAKVAQNKLLNPYIQNPTRNFNDINLDQYQLVNTDLKEFTGTKQSKFTMGDEAKKKLKNVQKVVELNFDDINFIEDLQVNQEDIYFKFLSPFIRHKNYDKENENEFTFYKLIDFQNVGINPMVYSSLFNLKNTKKFLLRQCLAVEQNQNSSNKINNFTDLVKNRDKRSNQFKLQKLQQNLNILQFDTLLNFLVEKSDYLIFKFKFHMKDLFIKLHHLNIKFKNIQKYIFEHLYINQDKINKYYKIQQDKQLGLMDSIFEIIFIDQNKHKDYTKKIILYGKIQSKIINNLATKLYWMNKTVRDKIENTEEIKTNREKMQIINEKAKDISSRLFKNQHKFDLDMTNNDEKNLNDLNKSIISPKILFKNHNNNLDRSKSTCSIIKLKSKEYYKNDYVNNYMMSVGNSNNFEEINSKHPGHLKQFENLNRARENQVNEKYVTKYFNEKRSKSVAKFSILKKY